MVRQGSLVAVALVVAGGFEAGRTCGAPPAPSTGAAVVAAPHPKREGAPALPLELRPYRIEAHVQVDHEARLDAGGRARWLDDWQDLARRIVGPPWGLRIASGRSPLDTLDIEHVNASDPAFATVGQDLDKVWLLQLRRGSSRMELLGREFDVNVRRLGPILRRPAPYPADLPRALFELSLAIFAPTAVIGEPSGGGVSLNVRGGAIPAASPTGRVVRTDTVFEPLRILPQAKGPPRVLFVPFTYLRVESTDGAVARCAIHSALRDPLTQRIAKPNTLFALAVKPGDRPTRLRFVTRPDQAPAAGYVLTARPLPDGPPRDLGTTDREGRIVLEPGFATGLVALRLLAGNVEPMVELPLMPGELEDERTIPFDPRPATVALETELNALRDAVIDLVAIRARLEARLKARSDGEDWAGVAETLQEFRRLPPRETFATRIEHIKKRAADRQASLKIPILTKTAQAQVAEVQALIERYLDDEVVRGYAEALERMRTGPAPSAEGRSATKPAPAPGTPTPPKATPRKPVSS